MGTGIGKDCEICGEQLDFEVGFDKEEKICTKCAALIPKVLRYLAESS